MTDEDKLQQAARKGHEAQAKLDSLKEDLAYLKQSYTDAWRAAPTPELREQNWYALKALERLEDHLQGVIRDGRLADAEVAKLVRIQERKKKYA